jgi:hypothetical protein
MTCSTMQYKYLRFLFDYVSEIVYLFLTMSSLHIIASDLDVRERLPWWMKAKLE